MSLLTDREKQAAAADVRAIILASGQVAQLLHRSAGENLYGHDDEQFVEAETIPVEVKQTPPEALPGGIDAMASVLPETDIHAEDRLAINAETFRIQTVEEENMFGVVTHKALKLVRIHAG